MTPKDEIWEALSESFGAPRTKTECAQFGKVVAELLEAGATGEETRRACEYVLANFDSPSVFAVCKWLSVALQAKPRVSAQQAEIEKLRSVS